MRNALWVVLYAVDGIAAALPAAAARVGHVLRTRSPPSLLVGFIARACVPAAA